MEVRSNQSSVNQSTIISIDHSLKQTVRQAQEELKTLDIISSEQYSIIVKVQNHLQVLTTENITVFIALKGKNNNWNVEKIGKASFEILNCQDQEIIVISCRSEVADLFEISDIRGTLNVFKERNSILNCLKFVVAQFRTNAWFECVTLAHDSKIAIKVLMESNENTDELTKQIFLLLIKLFWHAQQIALSVKNSFAVSFLQMTHQILRSTLSSDHKKIFLNIANQIWDDIFLLNQFENWCERYSNKSQAINFSSLPLNGFLKHIQVFFKNCFEELFKNNIIALKAWEQQYQQLLAGFERYYQIAKIILGIVKLPDKIVTDQDYQLLDIKLKNLRAVQDFFLNYPEQKVEELIENISKNVNQLKPNAFYSSKYKSVYVEESSLMKNITSVFSLFYQNPIELLWKNYTLAMDEIYTLTGATRELQLIIK